MRRFLLPMLTVVPALLLSGCGGSDSSDTESADTSSTSTRSPDTSSTTLGTDSGVTACRDLQEAVDDWRSHAINHSELFDQLVQVRKNAVLSEHQDIVDTGGALLVALTESDSTFAASVKNFEMACADLNH